VTLADRLRHELRPEHDAIELALDWERRCATRDGYRGLLERFYGFHADWEPQVAALVGDAAAGRGKLPLLAADLRALGVGEPERLARPVPLVLESPAAGWGSLYVLEGSTLGGQLIARHVRAALGFEGRYHGAYGAETGRMWRAFRAGLAGVEDGDAAVDGARRTFVALREWIAA
jgi:heme oxygenase (biliverdin-IX-beta and delta-forming)